MFCPSKIIVKSLMSHVPNVPDEMWSNSSLQFSVGRLL